MKLVLRVRDIYGNEVCTATSHADVSRGWQQQLRVPAINAKAFEHLRDALSRHSIAVPVEDIESLCPFLIFEAEIVP